MAIEIDPNLEVPKSKQKSDLKIPKGLSEDVVRKISQIKEEPEWMLDFRLNALKVFNEKKLPDWGPDLSDLDFQNIKYYVRPGEQSHSWEEVPDEIRDTFDQLGIPEHEKKFLAGVSTQYESEVVYHNLKSKYIDKGLIFESIDEGLKKYPRIFKKYFGTLIPPADNKFAALNSAVWSGGSFVYVPKGVKIAIPVETYFRINTENMGQFERTLIIAEEGSDIHYIEGCTAPQYSTQSLHAAVVELFAHKGAKIRYTTIQNWSTNVYNLVTKRAMADDDSTVEWLDVNIGSKVTMKYPAVILKGDRSYGSVRSMAMAQSGQELDTGAKMIHLGKDTRSLIDSRTISAGSGKATYRGISKITKSASNSNALVNCDGLLLDDGSKSYAYPHNTISNQSSKIEHEATVSKISEDQLNYLLSKGLTEDKAQNMIISGFVEPVIDELPMEYYVELERLLEMLDQREGKGHQKKS